MIAAHPAPPASSGTAIASSAVLSACERYRYLLTREWGAGPRLAIVMLNPSTADASVDDPTIRRCMAFARREGYAGIEVANLYALRATRPSAIETAHDPEGPDNLEHLEALANRHATQRILCAWGASKYADPAHTQGVCNLLGWFESQLFCLGTTAQGAPRHPLYVRGDAALVPYHHPARKIR